MCSTTNTTGTMLPYNVKINSGQLPYYTNGSSQLSVDLHRAQLQDYAQRLQLGLRSFSGQVAGLSPLAYHGHLMHPYLHPYFCKDPRARFVHEEPKPNHSYIGLIAMAILSSRDKKLVLSDIYQWILDNYNYFRTRGPGWRNSIRHNLSLNDCFIKSGRSANGKGHYWAIHPANIEDFQKGDFRRRRAQRRVRKHMGLAVPDDDEDDSPTPSPAPSQHSPSWVTGAIEINIDGTTRESESNTIAENEFSGDDKSEQQKVRPGIRRQFDVESLLAPDTACYKKKRADRFTTIRSFEEPSEIFAFEQGSFKDAEMVRQATNGNDEHEYDDGRDNEENRDFTCISGKINDGEHSNQDINDDMGVKKENASDEDVSENENESGILEICDDEDIKPDRNTLTVTETQLSSEPSSPIENSRFTITDKSDDRSARILDRESLSHSYFSVNNFANSHGLAMFSGDKQGSIRSVGQIPKFQLVPRQGLLGTHVDIEAAQRWQQSMATLLMKAQMKNKHETIHQAIE